MRSIAPLLAAVCTVLAIGTHRVVLAAPKQPATPEVAKTKIRQQGPEVGLVAQVYRASEGLTLTTLRIGARENATYILRYDHVDHPWSGQWIVSSYLSAGSGHDYVVDHNGKDYTTVVERSDGNGGNRVDVFLPGTPQSKGNGVRVRYDTALSQGAEPKQLLDSFMAQK